MNREKVFYLYLAGPITGVSYEGCTDWRKYIASKLPSHIKAVSPMRGKSYLKDEKEVKPSYENTQLSSGKGIAHRDKFDAKRCDAILFNLLGAKKVSIGTMMEVGWGDDGIKPMIVVMEKEGNPHDHPMLREVAGFITDNLDEAIDLAIKILSSGV